MHALRLNPMSDSSLHLSEPGPPTFRFTSRVDWWLVVLLLLPAGIMALPGLLGVLVSHPALLAGLLVPQALIVWLLSRTFYEVGPDALVARCGPFRWSIPLTSIRSISPTRSARPSPALSLDRIAVRHTAGTLLVSPRNQVGFVRALLGGAPGIEAQGLSTAGRETPESTFNAAAVVPAILIGLVSLGFGAWQFYAGTRPPVVTVTRNTLSISGLYSATVSRGEVAKITLAERIRIGRKIGGFGSGRQLRGYFEVEGLGRSRVFASSDSVPCLVIHTRTEPIVICFEDAAKTVALHRQLIEAWGLAGHTPTASALDSPDGF